MRVKATAIMIALVATALVGCASEPPAESSPSASSDAAGETCAALSEPMSLSFNAWNDFQEGTIDAATRNAQLTRSAELFRAIDATDGELRNAIDEVIAYIDGSTPGADGQLYDSGSDEFSQLGSDLGAACSAAGHPITINAHGG